jgi:transposase, IS6 family
MLKVKPTEVVYDAAAMYPRVLDELVPSVWHHVERYLRRGHYELAVDALPTMRVAAAFTELAQAI